MTLKLLSFLFLFILATTLVQAEIYRWVDSDGNMQFSDRPLNNKSEKIKLDTQRNSYGGGSVLERQRDLLDEYQEEDVQQQQEKQQAAIQAARDKSLQKRCVNAKDRLKNYQRGALYRLDNNGERIYYSEEERSEAINKYQLLIEENC